MRFASLVNVTIFGVALLVAQAACLGQTVVVDSDFSKGDFAALGWKAEGAWSVFTYADIANNPGPVARFAANSPAGKLTKTFEEIKDPKKLTLSLDYGWGWGATDQASDQIGFMLLDDKGNGYVFEVHRVKATWAVQHARVSGGTPPNDKTWAPVDIDATRPAIRDGGGMTRLVVTREAGGAWKISCKDWNKGAGATVTFSDNSTSAFTRLVLLGTENNVDEEAFNKIVLEVTQ